MYEDDFVKEGVVEFVIDKKKFGYKPATAGDENDWLNKYMSLDKAGKPHQDFAELNKCKIGNLKSVPYDKETINKIIKVDKEWNDLTIDQRWDLFRKLSPLMFDKVMKNINFIDIPDESKKKS